MNDDSVPDLWLLRLNHCVAEAKRRSRTFEDLLREMRFTGFHITNVKAFRKAYWKERK